MLKVLILGASYGSLLGTKIAMAGHDVTLVCRPHTVALINAKGTEVRLKLRDEEHHRSIRSPLLPGQIDAATPEQVDPSEYDLVALAMQEPQCCTHAIRTLLDRKSTRLNSSHVAISYAVFCLKKNRHKVLQYVRT